VDAAEEDETAAPKPSFNKTFNKRRLKQMPDSAFAPDPPRRRRWNQT
jgi:hypothetical protein